MKQPKVEIKIEGNEFVTRLNKVVKREPLTKKEKMIYKFGSQRVMKLVEKYLLEFPDRLKQLKWELRQLK